MILQYNVIFSINNKVIEEFILYKCKDVINQFFFIFQRLGCRLDIEEMEVCDDIFVG